MEISANSQIIKYLSSFMTCPSPYILQPRENKNYSLVLDLDETLVNTKFDNSTDKSQYCIGYRPYC
jgi:predicted secreted acid phosphatase